MCRDPNVLVVSMSLFMTEMLFGRKIVKGMVCPGIRITPGLETITSSWIKS